MNRSVSELIEGEPVATGGILTASVSAVLTLLQAFGILELDPTQAAAIFGLLTVIVTIITVLQRARVVPVNTVDRLVEAATRGKDASAKEVTE